MKNFKGFALGLVLGIGLAVSSIGFAQNATQTQENKPESCCAMNSGGCKGDSCDMKKHDAKDQAAKGGCCCCCGGDSCDMKMKHDTSEKPKG